MDAEDLKRLKLIRDLRIAESNLQRRCLEGDFMTKEIRSTLDRKREQLNPTPAELEFVANELRNPVAEREFKSIAEQVENGIKPTAAALQEQIALLEEAVANSMTDRISALEYQIDRLSEVKSAADISSSSWWKSLLIAFSGFGVAILLVLGFVFLLVGIPTTTNPDRTVEVTLDIATLVGAVLGGGGVGVAGVMYGVRQLIDVSSTPASADQR